MARPLRTLHHSRRPILRYLLAVYLTKHPQGKRS